MPDAPAISMNRTAGQCRRCGTCCLKGGPALHLADREQVESGRIPLNTLLTIRQGEPVFDNVSGRCEPAPTDIIKIAGSGDAERACIYLSRDHCACTIYEHRPLECRLLNCRDTAALQEAYNRDRLIRRDLIGSVEGLWELIRDHQTRCGYDRLAGLVAHLKAEWTAEAVDELLYLIRYDQALRHGLGERSPQLSGTLGFLLGLPLARTIRRYGLLPAIKNDGVTLQWIDRPGAA